MSTATMLAMPEVESDTTAKVGFRRISSKVMDLTLPVVQEFRCIEASPVEREINDKRVKHLREKVDAGLAVTFHWVTAKLNDKILRGNGQHSSTMLSQIPEERFPSGLKVFREHFECDTADDFALLFQQFDDRKSSRTSNDVAAVYQGFQPELIEVPHGIAKLAIDGYTFYQRNIEGAKNLPVGDMSYALFSDQGLHPWIKWLGDLHNSKTKELQTKAVTAAMFGTFQVNETAARDFWDVVSRGGDPDAETSPERVLDLWLRSIYEGTNEDDIRPVNQYQGAIYAWNAARENKQISSIKFDVKKKVATIRE